MVTVVWFTAILQHTKVSRLTTIYNFSNIKGIQSNSLPFRATDSSLRQRGPRA